MHPSDHAQLQARAATVRRLAPGRQILDVQARRGDFVEAAAAIGLLAVGVESSAEARADAAARGVTLTPGPIDRLRAEFHAVTLWDVIPHTPEPGPLVGAARRLLVPGGVIAVSAPSAAGLGARLLGRGYPYLDFAGCGHYHQVTPAGIAALFDRAGLTLLKLETEVRWPLREAYDRLRGVPAGPRLGSLLEQASTGLAPLARQFRLGEVIVAHARR